VILQLADTVDASGVLTFWAERWTARKPFSFRIDKSVGDGWKEIFNGDQSVRVGRSFLNHVKVPVANASIKQLRFTVTSPPNTGVLIDDIRIAPARPQKIVSVEVVPFTLPALEGAQVSPLVKLKVVTTGQLNPLSLTELQVKFYGAADFVDANRIYVHRGDSARYEQLPTPMFLTIPLAPLKYVEKLDSGRPAERQLVEGENTIWVACKIKKGVNIDHPVSIHIDSIGLPNGGNRVSVRIKIAHQFDFIADFHRAP
jgi:hypothetical protein